MIRGATGRRWSRGATALLAASLALPTALTSAWASDTDPVATNPASGDAEIASLIVKYEPHVDPMTSAGTVNGQAFVQQADLTGVTEGGAGMSVVDLAEPVTLGEAQQLAADLENDPDVLWAQPNRRVYRTAYPSTPPNDADYSQMWNLWDTYGVQIGSNATTMTTAWPTSQGTGVTVAVIDTGYIAHPDLNAQLVAGYDFVSSSTFVGTRANGYAGAMSNSDGDVLDTATYGAVGRDNNPLDPGDWYYDYSTSSLVASSWHGTHVAGTIGAQTNNAVGVAGVAPAVKIQPIRALSWVGGFEADIADAIVWASGGTVTGVPANATPSKVINMSLGGTMPCGSAFQTAITTARANGSVVVVSAGNETSNVSTSAPANCTGVMAVSATSRTGNRAWYSNYGTGVAVSAPGGDDSVDSMILSTLSSTATGPGGPGFTGLAPVPSYGSYQGTSMAAPHVSAVAALLRSASPAWTETEIRNRIIGTTTAFPGGSTCTTSLCGSGIVNAQAALSSSPLISSVTPSAGTVDGGTSVTVSGTNFTGATGVAIDGASVAFTSTSTSVTFTTPSHDSGAVNVTITTPNGTNTSTGGFTYVGLPQTVTWAPTITSALASTGTITPNGLATSTGPGAISYAVTSAGGTGCAVNSNSAVLTFTAAGSCVVTATAGSTARYAQATASVTFTITSDSGGGGSSGGGGGSSGGGSSSTAAPSSGGALQAITELRPASGPISGGNQVAIIGFGFTGATQVIIGTKPATFTVINDAHIDVVMPAGEALGSADVAVVLTPARGRAFAPGGYVYVADTPAPAPAPEIPRPSPAPGPAAVTTPTVSGVVSNPAAARPLGSGVSLLSQSQAANARTSNVAQPAATSVRRSPSVTSRSLVPVKFGVRGLPSATSVRLQLDTGSRYVAIGRGTTTTGGSLVTPALRFTKPGSYTLRLRSTMSSDRFITIQVRN